MYRDMKQALPGKINGNLREHQKAFDRWRKAYNEVRPHEGLGMNRPQEVYKKSPRLWMGEEDAQE
jgi:transposase InsO family protein